VAVSRTSLLLLGLVAALASGVSRSSATEAPSPAAPPNVAPIPLAPDSTGLYVAPVTEVRARRISPQELLDRRPGFATVLDAASWAGGMRSAAEVLARAVGVSVRETGGVGAYSTVSLRGSTAAQVPIYLDGVLLNSPQRGEVDLADVDVGAVERVEIYRGGAPLVLGGSSLGGAIHLFSSADKSPASMSLTHGSYGTWAGEFRDRVAWGDWSLHARARALRSEGDWDYLDDRGTFYNTSDDATRARRNNDVFGFGFLLGANRRVDSGQWKVSLVGDAREQGIAGFGPVTSETARSASFTQQLRAGFDRHRLGPGRLRGIEVAQRIDMQSATDLDADLSGSPKDRRDTVRSLGLNATGAWTDHGAPVWRLEGRWSRLNSRDDALLEPDGAPQTRWTGAVALQPLWRLLGGRLAVSPGARLEWNHQRLYASDAFGPLPGGEATNSDLLGHTVQIGARLGLGGGWDLKADLGSFERVPTLLEQFGDRGNVAGNPNLRPERGTNRDLGLVWSRPEEGRRVSLSVFDNDAFDLISFEPISPASARAFNVGRAEIRGLEIETDLGRFGPFGLVAAFTRMHTRDRSTRVYAADAPLPGRPGHELRFAPSLRTTRSDHELVLTAVGGTYLETGGRSRISSRVLIGWQSRAEITEELSFVARVDNLGDADIFDLWGQPLPGRRFQFSLRREVGRVR
jgi:iron complex outermembrane receptor protein